MPSYQLDTKPVLDQPSIIMIGGEAGSGKTTAIAGACDPKSTLWICSAAKVLHAPAHLSELAGQDLTPTMRITLHETVSGEPDKVNSNKQAIHDIMVDSAKLAAQGKCPYNKIVVANWDAILTRVFKEEQDRAATMRANNAKLGKLDHIFWIKDWANWVYDVCRANGFTGIFEVNERPPKFEEDEDSPRHNQMIAKRGPNMPVYTMIESFVNDAEAYIRLTAGLTGRKWQLRGTGDTHAKLRGFSEPPFVTVPPGPNKEIRKAEDLSLAELLTLTGYRL